MNALTPRPGIMKISPYVPGKDSVDGKEPIAKLSSNEGALEIGRASCRERV